MSFSEEAARDFATQCNQGTYYSSLPSDMDQWTALTVGELLKTTHLHRLPYTSSSNPDVWDALIDIDVGSSEDTVNLIYTTQDVAATPYGTSATWNREHLWPKSLGVGSSGYDYTDIHALRPSDWNVNSARGNKFFGECGVADLPQDCRVGHSEAPLARTDSAIWAPPLDVRGDIARAMFYMSTRYYGDGVDPDLTLVDCPNATNTNELAYLSIMLKWHEDDPVSDKEKLRNDLACFRWQGNRNPFVDHPSLVNRIYGVPKAPQPANGEGYTCNASVPPSASPTPDSADRSGVGNMKSVLIAPISLSFVLLASVVVLRSV